MFPLLTIILILNFLSLWKYEKRIKQYRMPKRALFLFLSSRKPFHNYFQKPNDRFRKDFSLWTETHISWLQPQKPFVTENRCVWECSHIFRGNLKIRDSATLNALRWYFRLKAFTEKKKTFQNNVRFVLCGFSNNANSEERNEQYELFIRFYDFSTSDFLNYTFILPTLQEYYSETINTLFSPLWIPSKAIPFICYLENNANCINIYILGLYTITTDTRK